MSRANGRPEAEVIVNYADGFAYSKHKMEEAFRPGGFLEKPVLPTKPAAIKDASVRKEDVELIVHEFEISKAQAEKVLHEHGGDINKALRALISPPTLPHANGTATS